MTPYLTRTLIQSLTLLIFMFSTVTYAEKNLPLIHVTAEGKATAQPDQVELHLDFVAKQLEVEQAREEVDDHVKTLLKKLAKFELDTSSLDSSQTQIYPQYDYRNNQQQLLGYQVSRQVSFTLKNLEQLEDLIKEITKSKVTHLNQIQFGLSDPGFTKAEALANAIRNSRNVAQQIAEGYDVQLDTIHSVNHRTSQDHRVMRTMMKAEMASNASASPSYQQKDIEFKASIDAAFTFK